MKDDLKKPKPRLRGIALPNEHGSWGILLEPLVTAIAVAPSAGGLFAAIFVIGAFLLRQPSKVLVSDLLARRRLPQTSLAAVFVCLYGVIALSGAVFALYLTEPSALLPLAALIPFGIFQLYNDVSRKSRHLIPELAGAAAISASAPAIALAGGWTAAGAFGLWCVFVSRSIPSIVYIRQRLRLEKGKPYTLLTPTMLHAAGVLLIGGLSYFRLASVAAIPVFLFLLCRCAVGLSDRRVRMKAVQLGIRETIYGAVLTLSVIAGYYLGI